MADVGIIKFQLANMQFGMFTDQILEIVRLEKFRVIPRPLPYVVGLMELRNYIVVIADLRKRLGLTPLPLKPGTTMIVGKYSSGIIGVLVESISNFRQISDKDILPPFALAGFPADLLYGVVDEEDEILLIPDLERLFFSYIRVQLLPISYSEKIAFHYRAVPGGITRTLETVLALQRRLDEGMIRKMSHAMSLPPVRVHKISSYYSNFHPQLIKDAAKSDSAAPAFQETHAGDERYVSLSRADTPSSRSNPDEQRAAKSRESSDTTNVRVSPDRQLPTMFEATLCGDADSGIRKDDDHPVSAEELASHREIGRMAAEALRIRPVRLRKFFTYYRSSVAVAAPQVISAETPANDLSPEDELLARLERAAQQRLSLTDTLQLLHERGDTLTRRHLRWLAETHRMMMLRLAVLLTAYRVIRVDMLEETAESKDIAPASPMSAPPLEQAPTAPPSQRFSAMTLRDWMSELASADTAEIAAFRIVAARLHVSTCRLHTLHTYYHSKEQ